jgi:hypothetical protein
MKKTQILAVVFAIALAGCGRSDSTTTSNDAGTKETVTAKSDTPAAVSAPRETPPASSNTPLPPPAVLTAGETAYVRIKQYSTLSGKPTITDMYGGTGYVLKNLNPAGIESPVAKPTETDASFTFGEALKLIEKKDGLPTFWLVTKGQANVWIPAFVLTANKAEIDVLKEKDRIPETMAFVYDNGEWRVWGALVGGIARSAVMDSHGLVLNDYPEGTSPFAFKGNAVMFDASIAKAKWDKPPVFDGAKKPFQLSPNCLYYCVSEGDRPAFECLDLATLKLRK